MVLESFIKVPTRMFYVVVLKTFVLYSIYFLQIVQSPVASYGGLSCPS